MQSDSAVSLPIIHLFSFKKELRNDGTQEMQWIKDRKSCFAMQMFISLLLASSDRSRPDGA